MILKDKLRREITANSKVLLCLTDLEKLLFKTSLGFQTNSPQVQLYKDSNLSLLLVQEWWVL